MSAFFELQHAQYLKRDAAVRVAPRTRRLAVCAANRWPVPRHPHVAARGGVGR